MNRGFLESLPVQQMMTGNPNWWNINNNMTPPPPPPPQQPPLPHQQQEQTSSSSLLPSSSLYPSSTLFPQYPPPTSSSLLLNSWHAHNNQELPESWSQLLLGVSVGEEERSSSALNHYNQQVKKLENWEEQVLYSNSSQTSVNNPVVDVKQEVTESGYVYKLGNNGEFQTPATPNWSPHHHQVMPVSSPSSCVTGFSSSSNNNILDFSNKSKYDHHHGIKHQLPDHSPECKSTATGGVFKKARVQPSSTQSTFKVRKEKVGDRITALHQLVSPFGKTDTASVLLEAIGYIRFLQTQIEALSSPYLGSESGNMRHQQQSVQGEKNSKFPEEPGQLINNMKRRGVPPDDQDPKNESNKNLRSRGLCLVPISCTLQVGSDNGADFWAPTFGGGLGFR